MNKFNYAVYIAELHRLSTVTDKEKFIRKVKDLLTPEEVLITGEAIRLADLTYTTIFKDNPETTGLESLLKLLNKSIRLVKEDDWNVIELHSTDITNGQDYAKFMKSPGVPAYLKLAVLQAQQKHLEGGH